MMHIPTYMEAKNIYFKSMPVQFQYSFGETVPKLYYSFDAVLVQFWYSFGAV